MNKEDRGQQDESESQSGRKPTNLEARLEEARALRKQVLARREQGMNGSNEGSDPAIDSEVSGSMTDEKLSGASSTASQPIFKHHDVPSTETPVAADAESERVGPPIENTRHSSRVAERLALGLGIGLGLGASLYLGASLFGARIGLVTAEASISTEQPQQAELDFPPVETTEIVSPTYISQVEPEALKITTPAEIEQEAEHFPMPSEQLEAVSSTYEMAPEVENTEVVQTTLPSPDKVVPAAIIEASLSADELDVIPSVLPDTSDIVPDETADPQSKPAPLPDQGVVKELIADPTLAGIADADVAEEAVASLVEPDLLLPGAEAYTVVLNAPSTLSDEEVARVAKDITGTGASVGKVDRVNFRISTTQIRFFRPDDAESAAVIAERMGAEARDFTSYSPSPPAGTVEMFLAGSGTSVGSEKAKPELVIVEVEPARRAARHYPANDDR